MQALWLRESAECKLLLGMRLTVKLNKGPNHALQRTPGFWRSVTERGCRPTASVTGCAGRHEARHSPRLRLAAACSPPRPCPESVSLRSLDVLAHPKT